MTPTREFEYRCPEVPATEEPLRLRIYGDDSLPVLVYLPGLHGDWTLVPGFRAEVAGKVRFIEFTYPRTTNWSLTDYARAIQMALNASGISGGWLLAESFGSQIAWSILDPVANSWRCDGLILAGGFVRHSLPWGVEFCHGLLNRLSKRGLRFLYQVFISYSRLRRRRVPGNPTDINEMLARRTEADRLGILSRLNLIKSAELRTIARQIHLPVFYLTGFWDPIVPWPPVILWLKRNCPGFRAWRLVFTSDHNVLGATCRIAAGTILTWMRGEAGK